MILVSTERRLAAIMFTDIVGYTALMAESEKRGLNARERHRALMRPLVAQHHGELIEARGDESVSVFPTALDAVNCALAIEHRLRDDPELSLHIGIHLGDLVMQAGEVSGDGVNIASRICTLSEGGGLCVSGEVHRSIRNQAGIETTLLGERKLKNVPEPVAVYSVAGAAPEPRPVQRPARLEITYFTKRNGARVAYAVTGAGSAVVEVAPWVNSLDATTNAFPNLLHEYLPRHHRLIVYDKQGTGLSERLLNLEEGFERHADEVIELLDHLSIDRAALVGGSQAAPVSIDAAARYPDRVSHLVVLAGYARGPGLFKPKAMSAMLDLVRGHWGYGSRVLTDMFRVTPSPEEVDQFASWMRASADAETAARLLQEIYEADVTDRLRDVVAPTLVIHRRGDRAIPYEGGQAVAAGIQGARLLALDGSAHGLGQESDVKDVLAVLGEFLGQAQTPRPR
jgi:class 3 adenylate cyclase/pimeloyl-ACP methyl ester carboxylesterase